MEHELPTIKTINEAFDEYDRVGAEAFLSKYTSGSEARTLFLRDRGKLYPLKAIWCSAFRPPKSNRTVNSGAVKHSLRIMGFDVANFRIDGVEEIEDDAPGSEPNLPVGYEGARTRREVDAIKRDGKIVAEAKKRSDYLCEACGFDFSRAYGDHCEKYIEAHHLEQLSKREKDGVTMISDFAMLCSNCHSMAHLRGGCLSADELRELVRVEFVYTD